MLWWIARRAVAAVRRDIAEGTMSLHAGGVAFFTFLSAFPALVAVVSAYGLFFDKSDVATQLSTLQVVLPAATVAVFETELASLVERSSMDLSFGVALGFVVALWSARRGSAALLAALDLAYDIKERRATLRQLGLEIVVTLVGVALASVTIALVAIVPVVATLFPPVGGSGLLVIVAPGLLAFFATALGIAGLYWAGPNRARPPFRWPLPAALISVAGMALGSWLFSIAVQELMSLEKTYGSLGTVAATLMLFYAFSWILLLGAELSGAIEAELGRRWSVRLSTVSVGARPPDALRRPLEAHRTASPVA